MNEMKNVATERCPGMSYRDMLEGDTRTPPDYLFEETNLDMGNDPIGIEPYVSEEFAQAEREKLWPNVWLFAAREDELPETGDTVVFEINEKSFLITRQADGSVRAFYKLERNTVRLGFQTSGRQGYEPARSARGPVAGLCHDHRE